MGLGLTGCRQMLRGAVAVAALLVVAGCAHMGRLTGVGRGPATTPYPVVHAAVAPKIDGVLDDDVWKQATRLDAFYEYGKRGQPVDIVTAYLAWNETYLYYAMRIEDRDLYVNEKENDAVLCRADVAELFVKPSDDCLDFYEFEFNMWNVEWDIHYISRGGGPTSRFTDFFDSGAIVRSSHDGTINDWSDEDKSWTVEVAIPLKAFARVVPGGPKPGDTWRFNAAGYDFSCYREGIFLFSSSNGNTKGFAEYEVYRLMQFMAPEPR